MSDTTSTIETSNAELRAAVQQRRDAVAAGLPAEQWYDHEAVMQAARERIDLGVVDESELGILPEDIETARERSAMAASLAGCQPALEAATRALSEGGCCEGVRRADAVAGFRRVVEDARPAREARAMHPTSRAFFELCDSLKDMHKRKSSDYGSADDPLANIRNGAEFVGIESWRGAMVRLSDKVTRLATYCRTGRLEHEGVEDTLLDLASYSLLALLLHREDRDATS